MTGLRWLYGIAGALVTPLLDRWHRTEPLPPVFNDGTEGEQWRPAT